MKNAGNYFQRFYNQLMILCHFQQAELALIELASGIVQVEGKGRFF